MPPKRGGAFEQAVATLVQLGFPRELAHKAVAEAGYVDINAPIDYATRHAGDREWQSDDEESESSEEVIVVSPQRLRAARKEKAERAKALAAQQQAGSAKGKDKKGKGKEKKEGEDEDEDAEEAEEKKEEGKKGKKGKTGKKEREDDKKGKKEKRGKKGQKEDEQEERKDKKGKKRKEKEKKKREEEWEEEEWEDEDEDSEDEEEGKDKKGKKEKKEKKRKKKKGKETGEKKSNKEKERRERDKKEKRKREDDDKASRHKTKKSKREEGSDEEGEVERDYDDDDDDQGQTGKRGERARGKRHTSKHAKHTGAVQPGHKKNKHKQTETVRDSKGHRVHEGSTVWVHWPAMGCFYRGKVRDLDLKTSSCTVLYDDGETGNESFDVSDIRTKRPTGWATPPSSEGEGEEEGDGDEGGGEEEGIDAQSSEQSEWDDSQSWSEGSARGKRGSKKEKAQGVSNGRGGRGGRAGGRGASGGRAGKRRASEEQADGGVALALHPEPKRARTNGNGAGDGMDSGSRHLEWNAARANDEEDNKELEEDTARRLALCDEFVGEPVPVVDLPFSDELRARLVQDWQRVVENHKVVCLPAAVPVNAILTRFQQSKFRIPKDLCSEFVSDLEGYFNTFLRPNLLYDLEVSQYVTWIGSPNKGDVGQDENKDPQPQVLPSSVYGVEHLVRLLVKLPEFLANTDMGEAEIVQARGLLGTFVRFVTKNRSLFSNSYVSAALGKTQ